MFSYRFVSASFYGAIALVLLACVLVNHRALNAGFPCSPLSRAAVVCPFCSSINPTIAEQLDTNDVVVVAKLIEQAPEADIDAITLPKATFEIDKVLKGSDFVNVGDQFKTVLIGQHDLDEIFMVMGVDVPNPAWSTPIRTNQRIIEYFERIPDLPVSGADRLAYFQEFFEDEETVLANDAYDEFALAPYADVIALKERMHHDKLIGWIKDEDVLESRKRLYFTMLGICGTKKDVPLLESLLAEEDRDKRPGLDAMAACYLRIQKDEGLPFIEKLYLANRDAEYIDVFSVIQALRFHTTEAKDIDKERIAQSLRLVLDHPKIADIVIPDLARLEDWSVIDRLAEMFRNAGGETKWVRTPIASYLQECPLDKAKTLLEEFRDIDAEAVQRAELMANFELFDDEEDEWGEDEEEEGDEEEEPADVEKNENKGENQPGGGQTPLSLSNNDSPPVADTFEAGSHVALLPAPAENLEESSSTVHDEADIPTATVAPAEDPETNHADTEFVTTLKPISPAGPNSPAASSQNSAVIGTPPVATITRADTPLWTILGVPALICLGIFVLLLTVINGWFEKLIF